MQGLAGVAPFVGKWMTSLPTQISQHIDLNIPGKPGTGGSDYASFVCASVPAFSISSLSWDYRQTYHNPTDTFDKVIIDDVTNNAVLTAMLTYLASEEPEMLPRDHSVLGLESQDRRARDLAPVPRAGQERDGYFRRVGYAVQALLLSGSPGPAWTPLGPGRARPFLPGPGIGHRGRVLKGGQIAEEAGSTWVGGPGWSSANSLAVGGGGFALLKEWNWPAPRVAAVQSGHGVRRSLLSILGAAGSGSSWGRLAFSWARDMPKSRIS